MIRGPRVARPGRPAAAPAEAAAASGRAKRIETAGKEAPAECKRARPIALARLPSADMYERSMHRARVTPLRLGHHSFRVLRPKKRCQILERRRAVVSSL